VVTTAQAFHGHCCLTGHGAAPTRLGQAAAAHPPASSPNDASTSSNRDSPFTKRGDMGSHHRPSGMVQMKARGAQPRITMLQKCSQWLMMATWMAKYELTGRPSTSKASKQASHLLCSNHTALLSVVQIQGQNQQLLPTAATERGTP